MEVRELLDARVQVVAGKGGVGRTTLALALALRSAQSGHRTLLLEVDPPESATRMLGTHPATAHPREVENRLWVCCMNPQDALREYALQVLRYKLLYQLVFENNLVRYLLRSIPSLAEFTMLGKMWWHATQERGADGAMRFDRIILDAPATGHAVTFLSVARVVADVSPRGLMKSQAQQMAQVVEDSVLHTVAVPEEMPVNEAIELGELLPGRLGMRPGIAITNRLRMGVRTGGAPWIDADQLQAGPLVLAPYAWSARYAELRESLESAHHERFVASARRRPSMIVPEVGEVATERERVLRVVDAIEAALSEPLVGVV